MSEHDFKDALRKTMDAQTPPPPMSDAPVLEAAHRDQRRRRTLWASVGSAAAVAAIAVGVVIAAPSGSGGDGVQVGNQPPEPRSTEDIATSPNRSSDGKETEEPLPPGMTDRTQTSGPHNDRGVALAAALDEVMTGAGFGVPGDLKGTGDLAGAVLKRNQAHYDGKVGGVEKWSYTAVTPVTKGSDIGEMIVDVTMVPEQVSVCDLPSMWGVKVRSQCQEMTVDGKKVAFFAVDEEGQEQIDQYAAYRHDDGTVVFVAQSADFGFTDLPALAGQPFTPEQLAGMAVDPRFKVTG